MNYPVVDSENPKTQPVPPYQQPAPYANVQYGYPSNNINMQPISAGNVGQCQHPNMMLNYEYDKCMLACIILLCIMWFPFGLYALFALSSAKNYRCSICGFTQSGGDRVCFYVMFGILAVLALVIYAVAIYFIVAAVTITTTVLSLVNPDNWGDLLSTTTVSWTFHEGA